MGRKHRPQTVGVIVASNFGVLHVVNAVVVNDMAGSLTVSTEMFGFISIAASSGKYIHSITKKKHYKFCKMISILIPMCRLFSLC